jgi:hypothetical protein
MGGSDLIEGWQFRAVVWCISLEPHVRRELVNVAQEVLPFLGECALLHGCLESLPVLD